jgi:hypothetical protein
MLLYILLKVSHYIDWSDILMTQVVANLSRCILIYVNINNYYR